jgi:hypothetical protein
MEGVASFTTMLRVAVSLPPVLVAVMTYCAEEVIAVGVPLMIPVEVSREIPAGRVGDTAHVSTCPVPKRFGLDGDMVTPLFRMSELGEYPISG